MSINGISNLNQYAAIQNYKTNSTKQSQSANSSTTKANEPKNNATNVEYGSKNDAVISDIARIKDAAKKPIDDAEIQRRKEVRDAVRGADPSKLLGQPINPERLAAEEEKVSKYGPIQSKMLSGKPLTAEEKNFLREHYPEAYSAAARIEEEVKMLKEQLSNSKSKEDADKLLMQKKLQAVGGGKNDNIASSLIAAFDEAYRSYKG